MDYYELNRLSHSDLKLIEVSIETFLKKKERKPTAAMEFGTLFHKFILEFETFKYEVKDLDLRKKVDKELILNSDITYINTKDYEIMNKMKNSILALPNFYLNTEDLHEFEAVKLFNYKDLDCKSKMDYINYDKKYIVDLKTISDITKVENEVKFNYITQAAFYTLAMLQTTGESYDFIFTFVENKDNPRAVNVIINNYLWGFDWIDEQIEKYKSYLAGDDDLYYFNRGTIII